MRVIWIDPGTTTIWYSIVEKWTPHTLLDYGVIQTTPKIPLPIKLYEIAGDFEALIERYQPDRLVIEKIFFTHNITTGIDVSQVRGVLLYMAQKHGLDILEYTPLELKSAICGHGKASKSQLQKAIQIFFGLQEPPKPDDAADAIGLAYMWVLKNKFD